MIQRVGDSRLRIYLYHISESFLPATLRGGDAGCITATGNVKPAPIAQLYRTWQQDDADAQQKALDAVRNTFQKFPMIPALKATVAHFSGDEGFAAVRPPLMKQSVQQREQLVASLQLLGFSMPGL